MELMTSLDRGSAWFEFRSQMSRQVVIYHHAIPLPSACRANGILLMLNMYLGIRKPIEKVFGSSPTSRTSQGGTTLSSRPAG
jgi:hypothetical protein